MKNKLTYLTIAAVLGLVSCGDNDDNQTAQVTPQAVNLMTTRSVSVADVTGISELGSGIYSVITGSDEHIKTGTYYQSDIHEKLLIINGDEQKAEVGFYALPEQGWNIVGGLAEETTVNIQQFEKIDDEILTVASFKGNYQSTFNDFDIEIQIDQQGKIISGRSTCKFSGQIYETTLSNMVKYEINSQNCEGLASVLQGYLVKDINYEPASFRMINLNSEILDLWFYEN